MDTLGQFTFFSLCVSVGFFGGVLYDALSLLKPAINGKKKWKIIVVHCVDFCFWLAFLAVSVWWTYALEFPSFRVYMWIGYLVGGILYLKTLHKIVAFLKNMCYNKQRKTRKKAIDQEKAL